MDNRNITLTIDEIHEIRYQNYEVIKNKLSHTIYVKDNSTWYGQEMSNGEVPESYEVWQVPEYIWAVFKCVEAMPQANVEADLQ